MSTLSEKNTSLFSPNNLLNMEAYAMITHLGCDNGVRVFVCVDKEKQNEMDTISL
jgi:hypothetical protein